MNNISTTTNVSDMNNIYTITNVSDMNNISTTTNVSDLCSDLFRRFHTIFLFRTIDFDKCAVFFRIRIRTDLLKRYGYRYRYLLNSDPHEGCGS